MADIKSAEVSAIIKKQLENFEINASLSEVGTVLEVGDGIARVYGLDNVQAGEMVEFSDGSKGMALNLENDNVGVVIFGDGISIKEGDTVKEPGQSLMLQLEKNYWEELLMHQETPLMVKENQIKILKEIELK